MQLGGYAIFQGLLWCSRMTRDELASDGINSAGDTREIGTDTHSQSSTN
jgi:hypothetical protein